jgi:hypothetical protein
MERGAGGHLKNCDSNKIKAGIAEMARRRAGADMRYIEREVTIRAPGPIQAEHDVLQEDHEAHVGLLNKYKYDQW